LRDLETNDPVTFGADAALWTVSSVGLVDGITKVSSCYSNYLVGGYNILASGNGYFERTYTGLPIPHNMIHFTLLAQPVDSWDAGDTFGVQFDSFPLITGWKFSTYTSYTVPSVCGNPSFSDFPGLRTIIEFPHSTNTLRVRMYSIFDQASTDESFGFRDISILFYTSDNPLTSPTFCGQTTMALPWGWCPCIDTNFYMSPANSGTCYACHITCASCTGPASNQCLSCYAQSYLSGGQCITCNPSCMNCTASGQFNCIACAPGQFLIPNGACEPDCPPPLYQSTDHINVLCTTPCPGQYAYWDESCSSSCNFPLEQLLIDNYFKVCWYPCEPHQYLYWNGTCVDSCPYPLTNRTFHSKLFCDYTCAAGEYLYWDRTCQSSCDPPLVLDIKGGTGAYMRYICDYPCSDYEYLYWNGSCSSTCDLPVTTSTYRGKDFCNFPCSTAALPILYWDGSCSATCDPPLILANEGSPIVKEFCRFPCEIDEFLYWNGTCSKECIPPLVSYYQNSRSFCSYPCLSTEYLNWDGSCISSCDSPLSIRLEADLLYCDYVCGMNLPYLYWNGTCLGDCVAPLKVSQQGSALFCEYPCSPLTNFLYWNGTCSPDCASPLTQRMEGTPSRLFCDFGCDGNNYLYWNLTCGSECPGPLVFRAVAGKKYCDYPCSGAQFLYWNSSCLSECNTPLQIFTNGGVKYCVYPCQSNQYLNWDGTCFMNCELPLKAYVEISGLEIKDYCLTGCESNKYLYWNGSCLGTCKDPMNIVKQTSTIDKNVWQLFCELPCPDITYYFFPDTQTCSKTCPLTYHIENNSNFLSCVLNEEDGWFVKNILTASANGLVVLVKLMRYICYIDMPMSPRLEKLAEAKARNILALNIGWPMSDEMIGYFINKPLPSVFERNGLDANFVVNFWKDFTWIFLVFVLGITVTMFEYIFKIFDWPLLSSFFEKLRSLFKWNLLLIILAINMDDIFVYSYLQFRSLGGAYEDTTGGGRDSIYMIFSLLGCLTTLAIGIGFLGFILFLVFKAQSNIKDPPGVFADRKVASQRAFLASLEFAREWQGLSVLFQGFKTESLWQQSFYFLYILRACCLPMIIAFCFYSWPIPQTVLQMLLNFSWIVYLLMEKPLKKKINFAQTLICESIVLGANFCMFLLACLLESGFDYSYQSLVMLGDMVIFGNFLFNAVWVLFFIIKVIVEGKKISKRVKDPSLLAAIAWLDMLIVWFQQGGLGFEEFYNQYEEQVIIERQNNSLKYIEFTNSEMKQQQEEEKEGLKRKFNFPLTDLDTLPDNSSFRGISSELESESNNPRNMTEKLNTSSPIIVTENPEDHVPTRRHREDNSALKRLRINRSKTRWADYLKELSIGKEISLQDNSSIDQASPNIAGLELISPIQVNGSSRNSNLQPVELFRGNRSLVTINMNKRPQRRRDNKFLH